MTYFFKKNIFKIKRKIKDGIPTLNGRFMRDIRFLIVFFQNFRFF